MTKCHLDERISVHAHCHPDERIFGYLLEPLIGALHLCKPKKRNKWAKFTQLAKDIPYFIHGIPV